MLIHIIYHRLFLNSAKIWVWVFPLVSTMYFQLKKNESNVQMKKNKNNGAGVPSAFFNIGNNMITVVAEAQFASVENGTIFGSTISGMYNHTRGPNERPKFAIKITNPITINAFATFWELSWMKNPRAMIKRQKAAKTVPSCNKVLRPNFVKRYDESNPPTICSKLRNTGIRLAREGNTFETISEP